MVDEFWESHLSYSEVARRLGVTRQNIYQRCKRGNIPCDRDEKGNPGVPRSWVDETLMMRSRDDSREG